MKNNYFDLAIAERRLVMEQTAIRLSLPVQAVEKDLWVTAMLQILFGLPCAGNLVFKGGTSLSKVWELINRFSAAQSVVGVCQGRSLPSVAGSG